MKNPIVLYAIILLSESVISQPLVYDDFEGNKQVTYGSRYGMLDSATANPAPDKINPSAHCGKLARNSEKKFDNIKLTIPGKLKEVDSYATYAGNPPQLKMKIFTTAPAGTMIEILLGSKGRNNEFPEGTHSQYQAKTTRSGSWEELVFKFSQIPSGSQTAATEVDQVTILFNPNSNTSHIYYFDDITGPALIMEPGPGKAEKK